jgi:hypothetical protein
MIENVSPSSNFSLKGEGLKPKPLPAGRGWVRGEPGCKYISPDRFDD